MHALSISTLPLESRWSEAGKPAACYLRDRDDDDATVQGNSASIDLNLPRRSMLVSFTCNACGGRSERLVNPLAGKKAW
eukprot:jgi/Picre1/29732/NNA_005115.t1